MTVLTTRRRGGQLPNDSDQAADILRSAFQKNRLMQDFGPELTSLEATVGRQDVNKSSDVAKVQSLLWANGYGDLKGMEGPNGFYSERDLERPLKKFQQEHNLKVDARVKPGGPTIRQLAQASENRRREVAPAPPATEKMKENTPKLDGPRGAAGSKSPKPTRPRAPLMKRQPISGAVYSDEFLDGIAGEEQSKSYQAVNPNKAWGAYQLQNGSFQELGLMDGNKKWIANNKYGVKTREAYLNAPRIQEIIAQDLFKNHQKQLAANGAWRRAGQRVTGRENNFTITEAGLLAAAHREGAEGVRQYLDDLESYDWTSKGKPLPSDKKLRARFLAVETRLRKFEKTKHHN